MKVLDDGNTIVVFTSEDLLRLARWLAKKRGWQIKEPLHVEIDFGEYHATVKEKEEKKNA